MSALLEVKGLRSSYGRVPALHGIDLTVNETLSFNIDSDVATWFGPGDSPIRPAPGARPSREQTATSSPGTTLTANVED